MYKFLQFLFFLFLSLFVLCVKKKGGGITGRGIGGGE